MRFLITLTFMLSGWVALAQPQIPQPDIQVIFPNESAVVDGLNISPRVALVIKNVDGASFTETLDVSEVTGLNIPDNTVITGFTAVAGGSPSQPYNFMFSLSTSVAGFTPTDVVECGVIDCNIFQSFAVNSRISSLDYFERTNDGLSISFETSFLNGNEWVRPGRLYRASDLSFIGFGFAQVPGGDNNFLTAYDLSESNSTFSTSKGYNSPDGYVEASNVYTADLYDVTNEIMNEFAAKVSGVNAYYSVDSGVVEFQQPTVDVFESSGSVNLILDRVFGVEGDVGVVITSSDGTAVNGVDYNGLTQEYGWIDGASSAISISIDLIDNAIQDGNRSFTVEVIPTSNAFQMVVINPNKNTVTVNIIDNDGDLIFADGFE